MLKENEKHVKNSASKILDLVGIPNSRLGYKYIVHAVVLYKESKEEKLNIMKVYNQLSNEFDKTAYSVEKAIRKSIEICVIDEDIPELNKIFADALSDEKDKINNKKFISLLAKNII